MLHTYCMPGGPFGAYNLGNTGVHETGARSRACCGLSPGMKPAGLLAGFGFWRPMQAYLSQFFCSCHSSLLVAAEPFRRLTHWLGAKDVLTIAKRHAQGTGSGCCTCSSLPAAQTAARCGRHGCSEPCTVRLFITCRLLGDIIWGYTPGQQPSSCSVYVPSHTSPAVMLSTG